MGVDTPPLVTVATDVLLLTQVPLVIGPKLPLVPIHIVEGAIKTGSAFTVTAEVVLLQPVDVCVKVNVGAPVAIPVTKPAFVTLANPALLLTHVPPVVGESVVVAPTHIAVLPVMLTVG